MSAARHLFETSGVGNLAGAIADRTTSTDDMEVLEFTRRLHALLGRHGTTLRKVVIEALDAQPAPPQQYSWLAAVRPPAGAMDQKNYRDWIRFMRAQTDPAHRLSDFERDVCKSVMHQSSPSSKQRAILWKALERVCDVGCGKWGSPGSV